MTGYLKTLVVTLLLSAICYFPAPGRIYAQDQQKPKPKPAAQQAEQEQEPYTEEEYDAMDKAIKEPDAAKRIDLLLAFIEKYPQSKLMQYIDDSYKRTMFDLDKSGNFAKLLPAAEAWLKLHPSDFQATAYAATGSEKTGNDQKYLDYAQKIYTEKPVPQLAASIAATYKKVGNEPKYEEWTEKLFAFPEFAGEYQIRFLFVQKNDKNVPKAAEYAQLTLKSLDAAKKPDGKPEAEWRTETTAVRKACWMVIATNHYNRKQWENSIAAYENVSKADPKFDQPYYYIGQCLWQQGKIEEAMLFFAMAELCKGDMASQAKEKLETLFKPLHNNTTIGIDKQYKKAQDELNIRMSKKP